MSTNKRKTRQKKAPETGNRKWTTDEINEMLDFCRSAIQDNKLIEVITLVIYYRD
jgi:hypothetical protein